MSLYRMGRTLADGTGDGKGVDISHGGSGMQNGSGREMHVIVKLKWGWLSPRAHLLPAFSNSGNGTPSVHARSQGIIPETSPFPPNFSLLKYPLVHISAATRLAQDTIIAPLAAVWSPVCFTRHSGQCFPAQIKSCPFLCKLFMGSGCS